ncbi:AfsR/SARP family transcriptional regulator [Longispora albida]|uniref:AfsR/SARP family transcriptional regulator n=1 Tax=Longispora albida TaxID=203523 RepID=UPI0003604A12|nr:BTAD domain-containing putative transcriptional regulator [Longispora albida]
MEVRILGALEIRSGGLVLSPKRRLARILLGMLALRANMPVSAEVIAEALWPEGSPQSAAANLRSYVAELRKLGPQIDAVRGGYLLRAGIGELDALTFAALAAEGRQCLATGAAGLAADRLTRASGLWRGPVLAGLDLPEAVTADARLLEDRRQDTIEDAMSARLALGLHAEVASEVPSLISVTPLRERLWCLLMLSLYRSGRQAEALDAYQRLYRLLGTELGVAPGAPAQELHAQILAADPALRLPAPVPVSKPWQLPPAPSTFTGRDEELSMLDDMVGIAVISGTAGVGKTALALHWAHQARDLYPDGCLYADLRGYGPGDPAEPAEVLEDFLAALGIGGPAAGLAGRYRTELAGRRMLVVLDNAYCAEQVRPLLPGGSCEVLVTSRDTLAGLVARDGASRVELDLLPEPDAVALLAELTGDPGAALLAGRCARLPLALRIAAELVVSEPGLTAAGLAAELAGGRLDVLDAGGDAGTAVRSVLSWSERHLPDRTARAFRLIGLHPGRTLDQYAIAALAGEPAPRPLTSGLLRAHLVGEVAPGRYACHDLLREYAAELGAAEPEPVRHAALARLLDQQVHAASAAMDLAYPHEAHTRPKVSEPATVRVPLTTAESAIAWLDTELPNLVALARLAAQSGWPAHVTALSGTLHRHLHTRARYADMLTVHTLAVTAATDPAARAAALHDRGMALIRLGQYPEAITDLDHSLTIHIGLDSPAGECQALQALGTARHHLGQLTTALGLFTRALALSRAIGDRTAEGRTLGNIGLIHEWQGEWPEALGCYHRALVIHRAAGCPAGQGDTLNNIAICHRQTGDYPAAIRYLGKALTVYRAAGDRGGEGAALNNLGLAAIREHAWDSARGYLDQALTVHRETGSRPAEVETLNIRALLALRSGHPARAAEEFGTALSLAIALGVQGSVMNAHYGLARALEALGNPAAALVHYEAALNTARRTCARSTRADALAGASRCTPDPAEQSALHAESLALYQELGISPEDRF